MKTKALIVACTLCVSSFATLQKINEEAEASLQKSIHKIELLQALYRQERTE